MMRLIRHRMLLLMVLVAAVGLAWFGSGILLGQDDTIPDCPEGQTCVQLPYWPPFTAVYQAYPNYSITVDGVDYTPLVTYRLEWRAMDDWEATIIDSERFDFGYFVFDMTGTYESVDGRTHTFYDSVFGDEPHASTLNEGAVMAPPGGVFLQASRGYRDADLRSRMDGETMSVSVDACVGDECHEVQEGVQGTSDHTTTGRTFPDDELAGIVFADLYTRIPLRAGPESAPTVKVLELQVHETAPDSNACLTNLRTVFREDGALEQQWAEDCKSVHRSGANAHYYTFTLDEPQVVNLRAESPADDLFLFLLQGAGKSGQVLDQNDNLGATGNAGGPQMSGIERSLDTGTYTIEVTTNAAGHSPGTFDISIQGEQAALQEPEAPIDPPRQGCFQPLIDQTFEDPTQVLTETTHLGWLWQDECRSEHDDASHAMFYTFTIAKVQPVRIRLEAYQDDIHVALLRGHGTSSHSVRESGTEGVHPDDQPAVVEIEELLNPGNYTIEVRSVGPDVGLFDLTVDPLPY